MGSGHVHPAPLAESRLGRIDARAKILGIVPAVVVVNAFDLARWPAMAMIGGMFAAMLIWGSGRHAFAVVRRALYLVPFVLFVAVTVPFAAAGSEVFGVNVGFTRLAATDEGFRKAAEVAAKAGTSILGIVLLSATTQAPELFKGLRSLGAPAAFVAVLSMVYRYLFEIGDEFSRLRRAAAARCFAMADARALPRMGTMAGALMARSVERSRRVHRAMLARGFDGEVRVLSHTHFGAGDAAFVGALYAVLAAAIAVAIHA